jgi:hypothetical protein
VWVAEAIGETLQADRLTLPKIPKRIERMFPIRCIGPATHRPPRFHTYQLLLNFASHRLNSPPPLPHSTKQIRRPRAEIHLLERSLTTTFYHQKYSTTSNYSPTVECMLPSHSVLTKPFADSQYCRTACPLARCSLSIGIENSYPDESSSPSSSPGREFRGCWCPGS